MIAASAPPLLTWALVVFLAGVVLGAVLSTGFLSFTVEGTAARMVGVAYCESTFDPTKVGAAGERGIWQFMASTWSENAPRLGYGPEHITDVDAGSRVAAEMWSRGLQGRWSCWR